MIIILSYGANIFLKYILSVFVTHKYYYEEKKFEPHAAVAWIWLDLIYMNIQNYKLIAKNDEIGWSIF